MPLNRPQIRELNLYPGHVRGFAWAVRELHVELASAHALAKAEGLQAWLAEPLRYCDECCRSATELMNRYVGLGSSHTFANREESGMSLRDLSALLAADVWEGLQDELPLHVHHPPGLADEAVALRAEEILEPVALRASTLVGVLQGSESAPDEILYLAYQHEIGRGARKSASMSELFEFKGEIYMEPESKTGYRQKISLERAVLNAATNEFHFTCFGIAQEGSLWRSSAHTTLSDAAELAYAGSGTTEYPRQPDLRDDAEVEFHVVKNTPTDIELEGTWIEAGETFKLQMFLQRK